MLAAGGLLERAGIAGPAYTGSMIDNVEINGPYIVVAPGFAFAHARPSEAVHRTGMSWVRLARPVAFGHKTNDPVTLVVALAATDDGAHAAAMAELAKVVGNPNKRAAWIPPPGPPTYWGSRRHRGDGPVRRPGEDHQSDPHRVRQRPRHQPVSQEHPRAGSGHLGLGTVHHRRGHRHHLGQGRAKEADLIMTSGEIAKTLGDVGVPVKVIENFTSTRRSTPRCAIPDV